MAQSNFRQQVQRLVAQIPEGKVMAYGQIAAICGKPRAARIVGGIAHYGDISLPWQRVVKKDGSLAEGFPGGITGHESVLKQDGITLEGRRVNMAKYQWWPSDATHL